MTIEDDVFLTPPDGFALGGQIRNPHRVVHVRLAAWNRLDVSRVGDDKLEFALAQYFQTEANRPRSTPSPPSRTLRSSTTPARSRDPRSSSHTFDIPASPYSRTSHARTRPRNPCERPSRRHDRGLRPLSPPLHPCRQERFTKCNPKKQASERRRSLRKSRSSKRSGSNSQASFTASLRDRPLADSPTSATKASMPRSPFHPTKSAEGRCSTRNDGADPRSLIRRASRDTFSRRRVAGGRRAATPPRCASPPSSPAPP